MLSFYLSMIDEDSEKCKFELLYQTYRKRMWYIANSILNDSYYAEDAIHNVFLRLIDHMKRIEDINSDATLKYLMTCIKNEAIDMRRKKQKSCETFEDVHELEWVLCNDYSSAEDLALDEYTTESIVSAIHMLDQNYREVLYLRYIVDLNGKEISDKLGRNYNTVRQQILRGKKEILKILDEQGMINNEVYGRG